MPTDLEDLVGFLRHGNTQIRQIAVENLVGYSVAQPAIFKAGELTPIKDMKMLVRDYHPIAKNVLTILINLSNDEEVLQSLAEDDAFLESLLLRVTNAKEPTADLISMLLANLAKSDALKRIFKLKRSVPKPLSNSDHAMDQLMDCFVKGATGTYNKDANFDYLAYFFADMAKFPEGQTYFTTAQAYDEVIPITKLAVFTEHDSHVRRKGVVSTIKNIAFHIPSHPVLLSPEGVNILPYVLLPLAGPEEFSDEDMATMLPDLQLLPPDKKRDGDLEILHTHVETLLLFTTTREGRTTMRNSGVYQIIREMHLHVEDEKIREACERLVDLLMRDEEDTKDSEQADAEDDEEKVVELF